MSIPQPNRTIAEFKLLAYVPYLPESARVYCAQREARFPYFRDGYVDLDLGRHTNWSDLIRESAQHFAIADGNGNVLAIRRTLKAASAARDKASIRTVPQFDIEDEPEQGEDAATA